MAKKVANKGKVTINDELTLTILLSKTRSYLNNIITQEEFEDWSNKLIIKGTLPLMQKMALLINLVTVYNYTEAASSETLMCELYKNMFFHVYLGGYLNVQLLEEQEMSYENYDLLEPIFGPWIEQYAKRDIEIFKDMLRDTLALRTNNNIINVLNNINVEAVEQQLNKNKQLVEFLDQDNELVRNLKDIAILNDPAAVQLMEEIKKAARNKIEK